MTPRTRHRHQGHGYGFADPGGGQGGTHSQNHVHNSTSQTRLMICFALTTAFLLVEVAAGLWTNSLALLSDAFHMLSDAVALGLAAFAARMSLRRPTAERTYGFKRFEVLAAFTNAGILLVLALGTAISALVRLWHPQPVHAGPMLAVTAVGLVLNLGVLFWMSHGRKEKNLNEESVVWHVLGDALGSVAALAAAVLMLWKGWNQADSIAGLMISCILLYGSLRMLRQSSHILIEGVPPGTNLEALRLVIQDFPQVREVHDLHVWTLTGRDLYLSAHVDIESAGEAGTLGEREVMGALSHTLKEQFGIHHITIQSGLCDSGDCGNNIH